MGSHLSCFAHPFLRRKVKGSKSNDKPSNHTSDHIFESMTPDGSCTYSGLTEKVVSFRWEIRHCDTLLSSSDDAVINSQKISMSITLGDEGETILTEWTIYLEVESEEWVGLYFKLDSRDDGTENPIFAMLEACIPNSNGFFLKKSTQMNLMSNPDTEDIVSWGWYKFLNRRRVKSLPLVDGTLAIQGKLRALTTFETFHLWKVEASVQDAERKASDKLGEDLAGFCGQPGTPHGGVKLVSSEGTEHFSNKFVLAARSPVFSAMFNSGMREGEENVITLEDSNSTSISTMLHYLHTGKFEEEGFKSLSDTGKVAHLADKYDLPELLEFCDFTMTSWTVLKWNGNEALEWLEMATKLRLEGTAKEIRRRLKLSEDEEEENEDSE